jgi:hypothetical protein
MFKLGDRVVWRSASWGRWAEKVGVVVYSGPSADAPEQLSEAIRYWLSAQVRDEIRKREPTYWELCRLYPAKGRQGGYSLPPEMYRAYPWTKRSRYKFERCASGLIVSVYERRQLPKGAVRLIPRKPLFYSPSLGPTKVQTGLVLWGDDAPKPTFEVP